MAKIPAQTTKAAGLNISTVAIYTVSLPMRPDRDARVSMHAIPANIAPCSFIDTSLELIERTIGIIKAMNKLVIRAEEKI